jgi:hypothetical protein
MLVVIIGLIEKVSSHILIGFILGMTMLSVCRSSTTGLLCHLYEPTLPIMMLPDDGGRGAATGVGQGQDQVELVVVSA